MADRDSTEGNDPDRAVMSAALTGALTTRDQWRLVAAALAMGGNVRVGLEDNFYLPDGEMATNAELVSKAADLVRDVWREPAPPDEAREILDIG